MSPAPTTRRLRSSTRHRGHPFPDCTPLWRPEATRAARHSGEEYLLERGLFRRLTTGESVAPWALHFAYPFRGFYSVLNAADYFRSADLFDDTTPDPRMADAVEAIRAVRQSDDTWLQERRHLGRGGSRSTSMQASPRSWLTFFAVRVLEWLDGRLRSTDRPQRQRGQRPSPP